MEGRVKEEPYIQQFRIREEILSSSSVEDTCTVYAKEEILPSCTVEDTCTVYAKE